MSSITLFRGTAPVAAPQSGRKRKRDEVAPPATRTVPEEVLHQIALTAGLSNIGALRRTCRDANAVLEPAAMRRAMAKNIGDLHAEVEALSAPKTPAETQGARRLCLRVLSSKSLGLGWEAALDGLEAHSGPVTRAQARLPRRVRLLLACFGDADISSQVLAIQGLASFLQEASAQGRPLPPAAQWVQDAVFRKLDHANEEVRSAAVRALTPLAAEPTVRTKLLSLVNDSFETNEAVARALAPQLARPEVLDALMPVLGLVNDGMSVLLRASTEPSVLDALVRRLQSSETPTDVRQIICLGFLGMLTQPGVLAATLGYLDDAEDEALSNIGSLIMVCQADPTEAWAAIREGMALAFQEPVVLGRLLQMLASPNPLRQALALSLLGPVASAVKSKILPFLPGSTEAWVAIQALGHDPELRATALATLTAAEEASPWTVLRTWVQHGDVQEKLLNWLGGAFDDEVVAALAPAASAPAVRARLCQQLRDTPSCPLLEALIPQRHEPDVQQALLERLQNNTAEALDMVILAPFAATPAGRAAFVRLCGDERSDIALAALQALAPVLQAWGEDGDERQACQAACRAAGQRLLQPPNVDSVRMRTRVALARAGLLESCFIEARYEGHDSHDSHVFAEAVTQLQDCLQQPYVIPLLEALCANNNGLIAVCALTALTPALAKPAVQKMFLKTMTRADGWWLSDRHARVAQRALSAYYARLM